MTRPRYDSHSTEFGLWLRNQPEIPSKTNGKQCPCFNASNIDYMWYEYRFKKTWMLLEEGRFGKEPRWAQSNLFKIIDSAINDSNYRGFHILRFEKTTPDDGKTWLDNKEINRNDLIEFLKYEKPHDWYKSYYWK